MKAVLRIVLVLLVALLTSSAVSALIQANNDQDKKDYTYLENTTSQDRREAAFKAGFISSCEKEGASYSYCSCVYNDMLANIGFNNFYAAAEEYAATGTIPAAMTNATYKCYDEI